MDHTKPMASQAELRRQLEAILRTVLGLGDDVDLGRRSPVAMGLTSLGAITLQFRLQSGFGIELKVSEILDAADVDTLGDLAASRLTSDPSAASTWKSGVLI